MLTALMLILLAAPAQASTPAAPTIAEAFTLSGAPNHQAAPRLQRLSPATPQPLRLDDAASTKPELSTQGKVGRIIQISSLATLGGYFTTVTVVFLATSIASDQEAAAIVLIAGLIGGFIVVPVVAGAFLVGCIVRNNARKKSLAVAPLAVPGGSGLALNVTF